MGTIFINWAGKMVQSLFFTILLFFRPFIVGVMGLVGGLCLLGVIFILLFAREQTTALLGLFSFGIIGVGLAFCYDWIIMLMAPDGFTMIMDGD